MKHYNKIMEQLEAENKRLREAFDLIYKESVFGEHVDLVTVKNKTFEIIGEISRQALKGELLNVHPESETND